MEIIYNRNNPKLDKFHKMKINFLIAQFMMLASLSNIEQASAIKIGDEDDTTAESQPEGLS